MTVEKLNDPEARLEVEGVPFAQIANQGLQSIKNTDALAIWCFLQSMSNGWIIRRTHIIEHFDLSRERYAKAMKLLMDMGYMSHVKLQGEGGRMVGQKVVIHRLPRVRDSDRSVSRPLGNPSTYKENMATKETSVEKKEPVAPKAKRSPSRHLTLREYVEAHPDADWAPENGKARKHMEQAKIPDHWVVYQLRALQDRYMDDDKKYKDWVAMFANSVVKNWGGIWRWDNKTGGWCLTDVGMAYKIKVDGGAQ